MNIEKGIKAKFFLEIRGHTYIAKAGQVLVYERFQPRNIDLVHESGMIAYAVQII